jgi:hypothetical protein
VRRYKWAVSPSLSRTAEATQRDDTLQCMKGLRRDSNPSRISV